MEEVVDVTDEDEEVAVVSALGLMEVDGLRSCGDVILVAARIWTSSKRESERGCCRTNISFPRRICTFLNIFFFKKIECPKKKKKKKSIMKSIFR
jgi:hypothetical protein